MKTYIVPMLANETFREFQERVSNIPWVFDGVPSLVVNPGQVTLDGTPPEGMVLDSYDVPITAIIPVALTPEQLREKAKIERADAVARIKVTTSSGNVFDGDEIAQGRMGRAIHGLTILNAALANGTPIQLPPEIEGVYQVVDGRYRSLWILSDNTPIFATVEELSEALVLSGATQTSVWLIS